MPVLFSAFRRVFSLAVSAKSNLFPSLDIVQSLDQDFVPAVQHATQSNPKQSEKEKTRKANEKMTVARSESIERGRVETNERYWKKHDDQRHEPTDEQRTNESVIYIYTEGVYV